jgi:hypothetical protein
MEEAKVEAARFLRDGSCLGPNGVFWLLVSTRHKLVEKGDMQVRLVGTPSGLLIKKDRRE